VLTTPPLIVDLDDPQVLPLGFGTHSSFSMLNLDLGSAKTVWFSMTYRFGQQ